MRGISIRAERDGDEVSVAKAVNLAFTGQAWTDCEEARIVARLRSNHDLEAALVAVTWFGRIVGQITFSPVTIDGRECGWCGLGPLAVMPHLQGRGIGSALVAEGIAGLRRVGMAGCVVLGEPGFYGRFGFRHDPRLVYAGPPSEYFQRLVLSGAAPHGEVRYPRVFE